MENKEKLRRGFTLVEMMIVVAIIGFLAVIALIAYQNAMRKSRDNKRAADVQSVRLALNIYADKEGSFPNKTANSQNWGDLATDLGGYLDLSKIQDPQQSGSRYYEYTGSLSNCTLKYYSEISGSWVTVGCKD